jgi:hypothetical protein
MKIYIRKEIKLHTGGDKFTYGRKFIYIREKIKLHTGGNLPAYARKFKTRRDVACNVSALKTNRK